MSINPVLLQKKHARIFTCNAEKYGMNYETAFDVFYRSPLYHQIAEGVSELYS